MKARFAVAVLAASLVGGACGDSSAVVASVGGTDITAEFMSSLRVSYGSTLNVNTELFRNDLSQNIIRLAVRQMAEEEFDIRISGDDIAERMANPPVRWQAMFAELDADADTTKAFAETQAELSILRDRVTAELIRDSGLAADTLRDSPQEVTSGCVRHILVGTESEAQAALGRVRSGEDFAAVATELSTDVATGGGFVGGCPVGFGGFVEEFASAATTAPLDEPIGPIESQFGFHVILVEERAGPPSSADLLAEPGAFFSAAILSSFFTPWFNEAVRLAEVEVAESVGRWSPAGVGIVPVGER